MSTYAEEPREFEERIAEALEEKRESIERIADSDTTFAPRAEAALDWLAEYQEGDDE